VPPSIRLGALDVYFRGQNIDAPELFEARALMEDMLAQLAVDRATPEDLAAIDSALVTMTSARGDAKAYLLANWKLHGAIARGAHSSVLSGLYEAIIALISGSIVRVVVPDPARYPAAISRNLKHHRELVKAIRRRDPAALTEACRRHTADTHRRRLGAVAGG
jgi:DNA-binding GntR family transcriptional regulator